MFDLFCASVHHLHIVILRLKPCTLNSVSVRHLARYRLFFGTMDFLQVFMTVTKFSSFSFETILFTLHV